MDRVKLAAADLSSFLVWSSPVEKPPEGIVRGFSGSVEGNQ